MLPQLFGKFGLQAVDHGVGIKPDFFYLLLNGFHVNRMRMADGNHGVPPVKIEIFHTVPVPYAATFCADGLDIPKGIYIK
ncbi:hypothetical protein SDC9_212032 [bioreactor metagenome]|uniref:Uncharacterized protein n=1 Tax=bioreactor metagenome TaxID=1076179 RepID=A0A645JKZ8_9ZZZZ